MAINFKNYNFNKKQVTALVSDTNNGEYLWIAFAKDETTGKCTLRKVSAHKPSQVFYGIDLSVDKITRLKIKGNSIYVAVEHSTIMGYKILTANPLTSQVAINRPVSLNESPVDIGVGANNLYYLFPGNISGEVTNIVIIGLDGVVEDTIELQDGGDIVKFATGITVDDNENLWICTYTNPVNIVRIWENSGALFVFQITQII